MTVVGDIHVELMGPFGPCNRHRCPYVIGVDFLWGLLGLVKTFSFRFLTLGSFPEVWCKTNEILILFYK